MRFAMSGSAPVPAGGAARRRRLCRPRQEANGAINVPFKADMGAFHRMYRFLSQAGSGGIYEKKKLSTLARLTRLRNLNRAIDIPT
jgi:hypothetical protein